MKRLYNIAIYYGVLGLIAGIYFREITKMNQFEGKTLLSAVHPHLLVLGSVMTLLTIVFVKLFEIPIKSKMKGSLITYHIGIHITVLMMLIHGTMDVYSIERSAAISGIAGIGHALTGIGLILLILEFKKATRE